jgi:hypothetical protein
LYKKLNKNSEIQIKALEHLIEADFDPQRSCQSLCLLAAQLFQDSDDQVMQQFASVAQKAYLASADSNSLN